MQLPRLKSAQRPKLRRSQYAWLLALPVFMLVYIICTWQWHPAPPQPAGRLLERMVNGDKPHVFLFVGILSGAPMACQMMNP